MRVVSGMRPTGPLHLGHYVGAIKNWISLQEEHECFFFSADLHALTSHYASPGDIQKIAIDMLRDWLACGIDENKATLFCQSAIPQHTELFTFFSMITPLGWLERNPTFKEQRNEIKDKDLAQLGFFSYPVMQTADIALYKGNAVPVGQDQIPHVELSREIVRRFNHFFGDIFPEPQTLLTNTPKLAGTDGRKMSKSYNNSIYLNDSKEVVEKKIRSSVTDTQRVKRTDPGRPEHCSFYPLHTIFSSEDTQKEVQAACKNASIGCVDCKKMLLPNLYHTLEPIWEKQNKLEQKPDYLRNIWETGKTKASSIAQNTLLQVKEALKLI
ncbi:MAG TPA: tryptophan--tRNA ligase [Oligoflexia bacterium]|nr:tryptophan--tRNA ligase [Oligoflexia bacterium]HMR23902.1 tryptophan--tRNA ligase [Oligoflexia bacterium]